jgi:signal transduction histidine kinase
MNLLRPRSLFTRLVASLGIVLLVSFGMGAWLSIRAGRATIRAEAAIELRSDAAGILAGVEESLAQRRTNVRVWSSLDVMEAVRTHDRDLRIETLLLRLQHEYAGTYAEIMAVDTHNVVVASTQVERIETRIDPGSLGILPVSANDSLLEGHTTFGGRDVYAVATPLRSQLSGDNLGWMVAFVDWGVVERRIAAANVAGDRQDEAGFLLLVDAVGNVLAGRRDLAQKAGVGLAQLSPLARQGSGLYRNGPSKAYVEAWVGGGDRTASTGAWRLVAFHDTHRAFAIVDVFVHGIWVAMLVGLFVAAVLSLWVARGVTRPVRGLLAATHRLARGDLDVRVPKTGVEDLRQLAGAFNAMADELMDARQRLEMAWRQEEAVRVRSEFVSHVSHELRTPITAILNYTEILRDSTMAIEPHERAEFLNVIHEQSQRLMRLINDLLDSAKLEAGTFRCVFHSVALAPLVQSAVDTLATAARKKQVTLVAQVGNDLPPVDADADRIGQVLTNLAGNAVKFTPEGGLVTITVMLCGARRGERAGGPFIGVESDAHEGGPYVVVAVRDTGTGIAPEDQSRVFDRFVQVGGAAHSQRGAGLGLSIAASIVEQHGGAIWLDSTPGEGSVFSFSIPVAAVAHVQPAAVTTA